MAATLLEASQCRQVLTLLSTPLVLRPHTLPPALAVLLAGRAMPFANHMHPQGGSLGIQPILSPPRPQQMTTAPWHDGPARLVALAVPAPQVELQARSHSRTLPAHACAYHDMPCHAPASASASAFVPQQRLLAVVQHAPPSLFFPVLMTHCSNSSSAPLQNALQSPHPFFFSPESRIPDRVCPQLVYAKKKDVCS